MNAPGLYGKLPTHGDFVQRNLPSSFVAEWDEWLQRFISGTKEQIGVEWMDVYLTSPIWRFVFSHGVIDEHSWAGTLMPSVDQVGRYFPFTIAMRLPDCINPLEFISINSGWYSKMEDISLSALDGEFDLDTLEEELSSQYPEVNSNYMPETKAVDTAALHFELDFEEQSTSAIYSHMLDVMMQKYLNSYSMWRTSGSERVAPCIFSVRNLPAIANSPALLDGEWSRWGWQQPYSLESVQTG